MDSTQDLRNKHGNMSVPQTSDKKVEHLPDKTKNINETYDTLKKKLKKNITG